jgi:hypothetical protein
MKRRAQARAHDGRRRDRDERDGQGLGLHPPPAGRRGALIKGSGGKRAGGTPPRFRTIQRHPKDLRALPVHPEPAAGVRTPMALGDTYCRGLRRPADRPECRCHRGCPSNKSTLVERSLCSIPWQGDFPSRNVPTIKDALRSVHWKLDDRPISMQLYEFAASDGPEETSATEIHQRIIAMATEQGPRIPA